MASTEASIQLPSIGRLKVSVGKSEEQIESNKPDNNKLNKAKSFLSGLKLGSLQRQKRPGDVWKSDSGLGSAGVARQPRPLGLYCGILFIVCCYNWTVAQFFIQGLSLTDSQGLKH